MRPSFFVLSQKKRLFYVATSSLKKKDSICYVKSKIIAFFVFKISLFCLTRKNIFTYFLGKAKRILLENSLSNFTNFFNFLLHYSSISFFLFFTVVVKIFKYKFVFSLTPSTSK
jgi:hypothetical protein